MERVDARRLTGPSHLARVPLVLVEVALGPDETADQALQAYRAELGRMRSAVGLDPEVDLTSRPHRGGAVFGYPAPVDEMLALAELSEWAIDSAAARLAGEPGWPLEPRRTEVAAQLEKERNPALMALVEECGRRGVPLLWDDRETSLGLGCRSQVHPNDGLPAVDRVPWDQLGSIPVALVTGTNGKTTSARLLARVVREAGLTVGLSSTDGVVVGTQLVEEGDWTGPAAARRVLRDPQVELAVLETARGGILRRGLAVERCDAALITNVTADHFGGYGIDDLAAMTEVKGVVARAVRPGGTAVLNARDPNLVAFAERLDCSIIFFADLDAGEVAEATRLVERHRAAGGQVVLARGGQLIEARGLDPAAEEVLLATAEVPLTFGGTARYNVENVLGVVAMARALGLPVAAQRAALLGFGMADNPGRGQLVEHRGVRVLLDFGHNPDGVRAVMQLVTALRAQQPGRLTVISGAAGDRSNQDIVDVSRVIVESAPDRVLVRELPGYLRGRAPGEVAEVFRRALAGMGLPGAAFGVADSEAQALQLALDGSEPGDLVVLLVHLDRPGVEAVLSGGGHPG